MRRKRGVMSSVNLEKVIEELKALTPEELMKVRELIDSLIGLGPTTVEEMLEFRLLQAGVISSIPRRIVDDLDRSFKPVEVKGKPVSETIIEERR